MNKSLITQELPDTSAYQLTSDLNIGLFPLEARQSVRRPVQLGGKIG